MSKLKVSILAPLAFFIVVLVAGFTVGMYVWQENRDAQALAQTNASLGGIFNSFIGHNIDTMEATLDAISRDKQLKHAFLAKDREALFQIAEPLFHSLRDKYKITHFYFSGPDRVNFLRVHQPRRFGDTINRTTTLLAHRDQNIHAGLELGPLGTFTLRAVMPWKVNGRLIGYLELGSEIDHVISDVKGFLGMDLHVFIPKRKLERSGWERGAKMLGTRTNWGQLDQYVVNEPTALPAFLIDHVNHGGLQRGGIVTDLKWGARIVSLMHKPIVNAAGEGAEIMVAIHDETLRDSKRTRFIVLTIVGSIIVGGALFVLFWFILDKVERGIRTSQMELIQAKEEAETYNNAKTQFLANMSHELRTPLNAILGFSQIMQLQTFGPLGADKYGEYIDDIHHSGSHLLSLINDILQISKIEAGSHTLHMELFCVPEFIDDCVTIVHERAKDLNISLIQDIGSEVEMVFADRRAVQQCLINLLSNAIKFTSRSGTVVISTSVSTRWFDFIVADTGIGIAKEDLPKLTQPFTQIERMQTARIHEGTGLGLTITRNLVEMHGGSLKIDSEVNVGTAVTIRLPRGQAVYGEDASAIRMVG